MSNPPDIISYDGEELILWSAATWKIERQGDVLVIRTPDGQPALAMSVYAADMLATAIDVAVMAYYLKERTNGR